ncbi:helix-turn-helix transcriptional regulator [Paenibacillus sp. Z6-24]
MNKTERLMAIVLELQRHRSLRAQDLADIFETSVRTIYRDMQALSESGVPLLGSPGQGYSLMEGYFLPPVSLTADEAVAMWLGTDFVGKYLSPKYQYDAASARRKIQSILPESIHIQSAAVRESVLLIAGRNVDKMDETTHLQQICEAVAARHRITFRYIKPSDTSGQGDNIRTVCPYGVVLTGNRWMLVAYCMKRQQIRHFRLSRMSELMVTDEEFVWPEHFQLGCYRPEDDRNTLVKVKISEQIAARLREDGSFYLERLEEEGGRIIAVLRVRRLEEIIHTILGWGRGAVVLEPDELRIRIREELQNMLESY